MTPDELVRDNLTCIFKSDATDVGTKRKHTDYLNEYINDYLVKRGISESSRWVATAAIKMFYQRNDAELFGDFSVATQPLLPKAPALKAEDIRVVLKALPLHIRAPLLFEWQTGIEINRVLSFIWGQLKGIESSYPFRINLLGRKIHRKPSLTKNVTRTRHHSCLTPDDLGQ